MKTIYHHSIITAFYLNCLPKDILKQIPKATKSDWRNKQLQHSFGYDWYTQNKQLFNSFEAVANYKSLQKINLALLRCIAIIKFYKQNYTCIKHGINNAVNTLVGNIYKTTAILGLKQTLKCINFSYKQYQNIKRKYCQKSTIGLCIVKHPHQLLKHEINVIKQYCTDEQYMHWSLGSVYHKIKKDSVAFFAKSTFYKYTKLLNIKRIKIKHRRKNNITGLRANAILETLHADVTIFRLQDYTKTFVYLLQDNFSRFILDNTVRLSCKAETMFNLVNNILKANLFLNRKPNLVTDDGSENKLLANIDGIKHLIAQKDIVFSNSLIEATNKQLKYNYLYRQTIYTLNELKQHIAFAIDDYNHKPHDALNGLSPYEVFMQNKQPKAVNYTLQTERAKQQRIATNKNSICCF